VGAGVTSDRKGSQEQVVKAARVEDGFILDEQGGAILDKATHRSHILYALLNPWNLGNLVLLCRIFLPSIAAMELLDRTLKLGWPGS
jgi:hypothetical protein